MAGLVQQSADVRFNEIDLSQIIASRSSSVGALVFASTKGRLGRFPVTDSASFQAEYGIQNAAVSFGHYAALAALSEMQTLYCARAIGTGYSWSGCILKVENTNPTVPVLSGASVYTDNPDNVVWTNYYNSQTETPLLLFYPKSGPGSYANSLAVQISSPNLSAPTGTTVTVNATGGTLPAGTYGYVVTALSSVNGQIVETVAAVTGFGTTTGLTSSNTITWTPKPGAVGYNIYGRMNNQTVTTQHFLATVGGTTAYWTDNGTVTPNPAKTLPITPPTPTPVFTVTVFDTSEGTTLETWTVTLADYVDGNGVQLEATQYINAFSNYINVFSPGQNSNAFLYDVSAVTNLSGGNSGTAPTNGQISNTWTSEFSDPEAVQVNILINGGYTDIGVQQTMLQLAETRGDAFAILDVPSTHQKAQEAIKFRQLTLNANTSYGALYTSDVMVNDADNGKKLYTPPSGQVAAVFARTDRVAGPQFQPAGLNRGIIDVVQLREQYVDADRTSLFQAQVNYMRNFPGAGISVFEATTLQAARSALSWVSVRRMLNVIKPSVRDFLLYSLHEPNDDFTRRMIVSATSDYLEYWKNARGILDYSVISDDTNNPPAKYNLGILTVTIFITPTIPVHEIQVDLVITRVGMSWSEINISNLG